MKRILTILSIIAVAITAMAQVPMITLSSSGKMQFFLATQLNKAIEAAQPNDTIYLSNGTYSGLVKNTERDRYEINKPLVIIGCGANKTTIKVGGNLYLMTPDSIGSYTIEGVKFNESSYYIYLTPMDSVVVRNSSFNGLIGKSELKNLLVDRSYVATFNGTAVTSLARNSKIGHLRGMGEVEQTGFTLVNCYINDFISGTDIFSGYLKNSMVKEGQNSTVNAYLENCLYYSSSGNWTLNNCTRVSTNDFWTKYDGGDYSEVTAETYPGDDGTPVGLMGGDGPTYSWNPSYPTPDPDESKVDVDNANKKLTVKVKLIE